MAEDKDARIEALRRQVKALSAIIVKVQQHAESEPELALTQARKSAEAICRSVFVAEIGEPSSSMMLDDFIKKLKEQRLLPKTIEVPLRTIQAYGNFCAHAQSDLDAEIDAAWAAPCLSALAHVTAWYFTSYLKVEVPAELTARPAPAVAAAPACEPPPSPSPHGIQPAGAAAGQLQQLEEQTSRYRSLLGGTPLVASSYREELRTIAEAFWSQRELPPIVAPVAATAYRLYAAAILFSPTRDTIGSIQSASPWVRRAAQLHGGFKDYPALERASQYFTNLLVERTPEVEMKEFLSHALRIAMVDETGEDVGRQVDSALKEIVELMQKPPSAVPR
jgi:hypothetical protein